MPREKRDSDETYNARRRYRRQAERFIKKADKSSGILKSRYEAQARNATINALSTYAKGQQPKGRVKQLTDCLASTLRPCSRWHLPRDAIRWCDHRPSV